MATEPKREQERREIAEEQKRERVRQAVNDLCAGINAKGLAGEGRSWGPSEPVMMSAYQAVAVLKLECPELNDLLDSIVDALGGEAFVTATANRILIAPLIEGTRPLLGPSELLPIKKD
jgi:hypothetical protein